MSKSLLCRQEGKFGKVSGETKIAALICLMEEPALPAAGPPRSNSQPVQWVDLTHKEKEKERKDAQLACGVHCGPGDSVRPGLHLPFLVRTFFSTSK